MTAKTTAHRLARGLENNTIFMAFVRAGYAANGVLHVLIGLLALQIAFGGSASADQNGALGAIAGSPGGVVVLWAIVVATVALGLFELLELALVRGSGREDWTERAKHAGKGVAYIAIGAVAATVAVSGSSSGGGEPESLSATVLQMPGGLLLLLLVVALGIAAIGIYLAIKGGRKKFLADLKRPTGTARTVTIAIGMAGYIAKGVALVVIACFLGFAAITSDPSKAEGLDGALTSLTDLPFGQVLLAVVALGLVLFGLYCFVRARRAKL